MLNLDKANLITVGKKAGRVIAVGVALPLVIVSAVLEGEVGPITRGIILKSLMIGEKAGEIVAQEAPSIVRELIDLLKKAKTQD